MDNRWKAYGIAQELRNLREDFKDRVLNNILYSTDRSIRGTSAGLIVKRAIYRAGRDGRTREELIEKFLPDYTISIF